MYLIYMYILYIYITYIYIHTSQHTVHEHRVADAFYSKKSSSELVAVFG